MTTLAPSSSASRFAASSPRSLRVASLRRFQDDVAEVAQGFECGLAIAQLEDVRPGDLIEAYELVRIQRVAA